MANTRRYKKEYCEMLKEHAKTGRSYTAFAAEIGVCRDTLYDWEQLHPEWKAAKKEAFDTAFNFWEKLLISKAVGQKKDIDLTAVIFTLKTRFHKEYGEYQKIAHVGADEEKPIEISFNPKAIKRKE
jgi:hypothetical protein